MQAYDDLVHEFMLACKQMYGEKILIQVVKLFWLEFLNDYFANLLIFQMFWFLYLKGAIEVVSCSSAATTFSSLLAVCWHELKPLLSIHFLFTHKTCGEALVELGNWQVVIGVERSLRILQTRTLSVCFKSTTRRILSSTMTSRLFSFFVFFFVMLLHINE